MKTMTLAFHCLANTFARLLRRTPTPPRTHDLTKLYPWFRPRNGGQEASMGDWSFFDGPDPVAGDFVILRNGNETTRYRVESFKRMFDPRDQWFMEVTFAPRASAPLPQAFARTRERESHG